MIQSSSGDEDSKKLSRMELEAMAQATVREGLSKEQVAYEQWVDTQPIDDAVAWDEMGEEARMKWVAEHMGDKEELVVEVQEVVEKRGNFCLSSETKPILKPQAIRRVWIPTSTEGSEVKNKPQCPPCARLKRTWTRCRGGPPCIECQNRGLSAEQCQSYDLLQRSRKSRPKKREEGSSSLKNQAIQEKGIAGGIKAEEEGEVRAVVVQ